MRRAYRAAAVAVTALLLAGCQGSAEPAATRTAPSEPFTLTLPEVTADGSLPDWSLAQVNNQCDGENRSPTLEWSNAPTGTEGFAVAMVNPEQPRYPHWVVTGIGAGATGLASAEQGQVTEGVVGSAFLGSGSYVGPCWADAEYQYIVYALDTAIVGNNFTSYDRLLTLIEGHVLAEATATALAPDGAYDAG